MAAMPMAAVSVRETNRSDHSPYAAVSPQVSPRSTAVASASTRPSPDSMSASTDSRVTAASNIVRRAASSTSVTNARQCGTVTWSGCCSHVIGSSRSPRSSSSRASASSWVSRMRAIAPVDGHHGRGCLSQPAASAPSTNWRSAVNGARCRRPRRKAGSSHSMRISSHASAIWSRDDITTSLGREEAEAARSQAPAQLPRSASSWAARTRSPSVSCKVGQVSRGRRPTSGRPMSPCATRSAHRTMRSSSTEACTAATCSSCRISAGSRHARSGIPSASSPSASSSSACGTSRTAAGQANRPSGSTAVRRASASCRLSSRPALGRRRGQNRVRLKLVAASSTDQMTT